MWMAGHFLWVPCRDSLYLPILFDLIDTWALEVSAGYWIAIAGFAGAVHAEYVQDPYRLFGQTGALQVSGSSITHFR